MYNYLYYFLYQPLSQFEIVLGNSNIYLTSYFSFYSFILDNINTFEKFTDFIEKYLNFYFIYYSLKSYLIIFLKFVFHYFGSIFSFIFIYDFSTQIIGPSNNTKNFFYLIDYEKNIPFESSSYFYLLSLIISLNSLSNNEPFITSILVHIISFLFYCIKDLLTLNYSDLILILYFITLLNFFKIFQFLIYLFNNDIFNQYNNYISFYLKYPFYKSNKYISYYFIDYSLTKFHTTVFFILVFFFIFFVLNLKKEFFFRPSINFIIFALIDKFLTNTIVQQLGIKRGQEFSVVLKTFFFLILFANLFGLIPFSFTITSHLVFTFGLSFAIISTITIFGFYKQGFKFLNLLIPGGAPKALLPILIPIELLSYIVRCFSLAIRLFANMMSGHSLLYILSGFVIQITAAGFFLIALAPFVIVLLIGILEIGVAMLQAYVFLVLTCIYLRDGYQAGH